MTIAYFAFSKAAYLAKALFLALAVKRACIFCFKLVLDVGFDANFEAKSFSFN